METIGIPRRFIEFVWFPLNSGDDPGVFFRRDPATQPEEIAMKRGTFDRIVSTAVFLMMLFAAPFLSPSGAAGDYTPLPGEGKQIWIGKDHYFVYAFSQKPSLGTVILKVEVYDKDGKRDTSLGITGDSGMPSMAGHHDTGDVPLKQNKKGDYLLPVNVVMPGDWEVRLTFRKDDKPIFQGSIPFHV
jgi:hypothetical protein